MGESNEVSEAAAIALLAGRPGAGESTAARLNSQARARPPELA